MILAILFILSSIVSLISLFYSISSGYFEERMYERKKYTEKNEVKIDLEKEQIIAKYARKAYLD